MTAWSLQGLVTTSGAKNLNASAQTGGESQDAVFASDGKNIYLLSADGLTIYQYAVGTAWDITTATYGGKSFTDGVIWADDAVIALNFKTDGTKLYVFLESASQLYEYTLSTPWDITTAVYANLTVFSDFTLEALRFNADGSKLIAFNGVNTVLSFTLSTPWNISTATYDSKSFTQDQINGDTTALDLKTDGTKLYLYLVDFDGFNGGIYQYTLATPYDLTTCTYDTVFVVDTFNTGNPITAVQWKNNGLQLIELNTNISLIVEYDLPISTGSGTIMICSF